MGTFCRGLSYKEIATPDGVGRSNVRNTIYRIHDKTGVGSNQETMVRAVAHQLPVPIWQVRLEDSLDSTTPMLLAALLWTNQSSLPPTDSRFCLQGEEHVRGRLSAFGSHYRRPGPDVSAIFFCHSK